MTELRTGIVYDMPIEEYHAHPHLSNSGLSDILRSPAHYKAKVWTDSKAKRIGSAVHAYLLEPDRVDVLLPTEPVFDTGPGGGITKKGRAEKAEWESSLKPGTVRLEGDEREIAQHCAHALKQNEYLRNTRMFDLSFVKTEVSIFSVVETDEGPCYYRTRPDILSPLGVITDVKTAENADPTDVIRHAFKYGYHTQQAMYLRGAASNDMDHELFLFAVVEKEAPWATLTMTMPDELVEQGDRDFMRAATIWAKCHRTGEWPSYPTEVITPAPKRWMLDPE